MDRYQVVTLQAAVYVVDNDEMQASRFAGDWNAHASCELLNSGAMPRTDLDWIDLEPESGEPSPCAGCGGDGVQIDDDPESTRQIVSTCGECRGSGSAVQDHTNR